MHAMTSYTLTRCSPCRACCARCAVQEEKNAAQLLDEEERPQFVPTSYDSLRRVSAA